MNQKVLFISTDAKEEIQPNVSCIGHGSTHMWEQQSEARAGGPGDQGQPGLHKDTLPHKRGNSEKILHPSDKNDNKLGSYYK